MILVKQISITLHARSALLKTTFADPSYHCGPLKHKKVALIYIFNAKSHFLCSASTPPYVRLARASVAAI